MDFLCIMIYCISSHVTILADASASVITKPRSVQNFRTFGLTPQYLLGPKTGIVWFRRGVLGLGLGFKVRTRVRGMVLTFE